MAKTTEKPKIKDFAYYACIPHSEKVFITTMSSDVKGYWSFGDQENVSTGRNMCLMARQTIECDEGY